MKKIFLTLFIIGLQYNMYGQYGEYCSTNRSDFYVQTPKGTDVKALYTSDHSNTILQYWWTKSNDYALYVIDCNNDNRKYYNCHGYAWYMSEGVITGKETAWIDNIMYEQQNVSKYWTDGSYEVYDYKNKPHLANLKVYYGECGNWDHMAVTTDDPDIFISKMASGCLVAHRWDDSPFRTENLTYYKKVSVISGTDVVCYGNGSVYTLNNPPSGSYTIYWELMGNTGNFTLSNTTGTSTTVKRIGLGNGSVKLKATIYNTGTGNTWVFDIKEKKPCIPTIDGDDVVCYNGKQFDLINPPDAIYWTLPPNSPFTVVSSSGYVKRIGADTNSVQLEARLVSTGALVAQKPITPCPPIIINGPATICPSGVYSINDNQSATWSITPSGFNLSSLTGNSTTVTVPMGTALNGQNITLTAVVNGEIIERDIKVCAPSIVGTDNICNTVSYTLTDGVQAMTWTVATTSGPSGFNIVSSNTAYATVTATTSTGQIGFILAVVNGSPIKKNIVQACIPYISGPTSMNVGSFAYFYVDEITQPYTWDCSSHFTPVSGSPGQYTATGIGSGWIRVLVNGTEVARQDVIINPLYTISGPASLNVGSPAGLYIVSNPPPSFTWDYSSNLKLKSYGPGYGEFTALSTGPGWIRMLINGAEVGKHSVLVNPANYPITDPDKICYLNPATYTVTNGTATYWYIKPGHLYTITSSNSTSATITTSANHGETGLLTVIVNGIGYDIMVLATCDRGVGNTSDSYVLVYPNPVSDILNIEINAAAFAEAQEMEQSITDGKCLQMNPVFDIRLYDVQSNLLRKAKTKSGAVQFNVENLLDGFYYLHIYDGINEIPVMRQIVIEH